MKHNLLKSVIISVILLMGVSNAWGKTNTTVYYAVPTSVVGSYTVKCNVNYKGDGDWWEQHGMTKTDKTYDGDPIYSCTFTDQYDGLGCLQFQLYDGNTHKGQQQPIGSWTSVSTYNGKLLKHNQAGWNTYRYDQHGFEAANNGIKYYSNVNANDEEWNFNGQSAQTKELGEVTKLYLKEWFVQLYENWAGAQGNIKFQYNIHPTANSAGNYTEITKKWENLGNWNNGWLYPKYGNNEQNINLLNGLPGSGKYTMSFKYYDSDLKLTSPVHKLNWTYNIVPSVNNFKVTVSRENIVSGNGTNGDPYVIASGKTITLTVSGSQASTDANSSLYAKFGSDAYTSTLTKTLTPSSTKQSVQVKAKYYNSKDNLSGAETTTQTIYYRAQTFAVKITSSGNGTVTPSGTQQVGATAVNISASPNTGYAFKQWNVTGGAKVASTTSASTTVTATDAGTVTAVFEEITYKVYGFGNWNTERTMTKKPSAQNEKVVYYTYTADGTNIYDGVSNDAFKFKIYDPKNNKWYGITGDTDQYWYTRGMGQEPLDDKNTGKNIEIRADVKGDYEIKVDYSDPNSSPKITVTYPQKPYYLSGTWDNWVDESPIENKPVTIRLEKGNYSFKIFNYQTVAEYYGNPGEMTRNQSSGWTMTNGANDCRIYADLSGNYTFTFDKSTKKLTVTYPTAYKMTYGINNAKYGTVKAEVNYKSVESGKYWYPNTEFTFSYELTKGTLFKGWYDNANGTGEPLSTNPIYTHTLGADANVYAVCEDGYKITIDGVSYYFVNHNGQRLNSILIDFKENTSFNAPLYKGDTKKDTGNGNYTAPVTGTYTCAINPNKNGVTWTPPYKVGDYRLFYVDQVVEKGTDADSWKTVVRRTYEHPSDVVKKSATAKRDVVSLHIFTKHENPEVILQQYQTVESKNQWVDIEAHMVNGPLETVPGMAMLPGRKNAGENSSCDDFVYDDGIEIIKTDDTDAGCGVWDFTIVQNGETATLDLTSNGLKRYTGKYYIRTSSAPGQWSNYQIPENEINESHYASENFRQNNPEFVENEYFTHYFCKYVDKTKTANVKFIIANKHGMAISKEFTQDAFTTSGGDLAGENANVRFAWNQITNTCKRAYIAGSFDKTNEFLYVKPEDENKVTTKENTNGVKGYFNDNTNWLYYADVLAQPGAKVQVVAKYNEKYQYFMGEESGGSEFEKLIAGDENDKTNYPIRILYEFPEHRFVVAYMPPSTITGDVAIETPVMLIRKDHGEANQITFSGNEKKITAPLPAYGTITFTEGHLKDNNKTIYDKALYWISFPFDVQISDVFGFGKYGEDWIIEYYNGERRSKEGLTSYNTYWEYNWNKDYVLEAGKGYVLCLDIDKVITHFLDGANDKEEISLYFPSTETIAWGDIKKQGTKVVTLNQHPNTAKSATDHNWHVIGVPSYANTDETTQQDNTAFLYKYQAADDSYIPASSTGMTFQSMHAYMVQYAGTINWNNYIAPETQAIAARKNNGEQEKHALRLELSQKGKYNDQTFVTLQDDNATTKFDLNTDLPKIINVGANIYSIISEEKIKLAGNVMPIQETIIPLGVVISAAGEYTFAMPDGTDGIVVELIDYETNTRTNMLLDNYTVNLGKGTFESRFALHVKPNKTTTSLEDVNTNTTGVKKYLIDGILYMQKDGVLYDAQGKLVR